MFPEFFEMAKRTRRALIAKVQVRWMIRRDMPRVLSIDTAAACDPFWTEEDFLECLRKRNCIGMVATTSKVTQGADIAHIRGFMVYELNKTSLRILRFAVDPAWEGLKVGTAMIEKLKMKLSQQRRSTILCDVPERSLEMQLFLRAVGFRAAKVERADDGDVYTMRYRAKAEC